MYQELINKGYSESRALELCGVFDCLSEGYDYELPDFGEYRNSINRLKN